MKEIKNLLFIISYNQEKYIKSCIDSINELTVKPNRIIWLDDGSSDKTLEFLKIAILDSKDDLNSLIDIRSNEKNVGIYKNLNRAFDFPDEKIDYFHFLACDDWFTKNYFKDFNEYVLENVTTEKPHLVCSNHISVTKNNKYIFTKYDKKLANIHGLLRNKFSARNLGISKQLFNKLKKYDEDIGIWADRLFDFHMLSNACRVYLMDGSYHNYRIGVGYSSRIDRKLQSKSLKQVCNKILENFEYTLNKKDVKFLTYSICLANTEIKKNYINIIYLIYQFIINVNNGASIKDFKIFIPNKIFTKLKNYYNEQ